MNFNLSVETDVIFGNGSLKNIQKIVETEGFKKALILTDKGIKDAGLIEELEKYIKNRCEYVIFDGVEPNPTDVIVEKVLQIYKEELPDFFIAIGGGSSIDTAKAVAIVASNGGKIKDYKGLDKVKRQIKPIVAIPTTSGTGSEITTVTVITDTKSTLKYSVSGTNVANRWALVDPSLTISLPAHMTAATGVDALVHAIEAFTSKKSNPLTDALAKQSIKLIGGNLRNAVFHGENIEYRSNMMVASLMAGIAFDTAKLGLCHVLCNPLSAHFNIPHGVANAVLLPYVTEYNLPSHYKKYSEVAALLGEIEEGKSEYDIGLQVVNSIKRLLSDINLPLRLSELNVNRDYIPRMVDECIDNPLVNVNPRHAKREDLINIYENAY